MTQLKQHSLIDIDNRPFASIELDTDLLNKYKKLPSKAKEVLIELYNIHEEFEKIKSSNSRKNNEQNEELYQKLNQQLKVAKNLLEDMESPSKKQVFLSYLMGILG